MLNADGGFHGLVISSEDQEENEDENETEWRPRGEGKGWNESDDLPMARGIDGIDRCLASA